jgi:hypothetical protein
MPNITIVNSHDFNLNVLTGETGEIIVDTDAIFPDPAPNDIYIGLRVRGANPNIDISFGLETSLWILGSDATGPYYDGFAQIDWATWAPGQPVTIPVAANNVGETGNRQFSVQLYDPNAIVFYLINPAAALLFTIESNPTEIVCGPGQIGFEKKWHQTDVTMIGYGVLYNDTGADIDLLTLGITGDENNIASIKYRVSNAAPWKTVAIDGPPTIPTGDFVRFGVTLLMDRDKCGAGPNCTNTSGMELRYTYDIADSPRECIYPLEDFEITTAEDDPAECDSLDCIVVKMQPFTWTDGNFYAGFNDCSVLPGGKFTLPKQYECTVATPPVTFTFRLTNNCLWTCPDGSPGYVRIGQLTRYWQSMLEDNAGTCVLVPPTMTTDADAVLVQGAFIEFQVIYSCNVAATGVQSFKVGFAAQKCGVADDNDAGVGTDGRNDTVDMLGISPTTSLGINGIDPNNFGISPVPLSLAAEGEVNQASGIYAYDWAAKTANTYNQTSAWFVAPDDGTYYVRWNYTLPYKFPPLVADERTLAIFKNGVYEQTIADGTDYKIQEWVFGDAAPLTIALLTGDTLAIGAWVPDGYEIDNNFSVSIARVDSDTTGPACELCLPEVEWETIDWDVDVSPGSIDFGTVIVGSPITQLVTVTNNGSDTFNVTGVTQNCDNPPITNDFVGPVPVAPAGNITFNVECDPVEAGNQACVMQIATDGFEDFDINITWIAAATPPICDSTILNNANFPTTINVTGLTDYTGGLSIDTGNFSGLLTLNAVDNSGNDTFSFFTSLCGNNQTYCVNVGSGQTYTVGYTVNAPCSPTPYTISLTGNITDLEGRVCPLNAILTVNVDCATIQTCPVTITPGNMSEPTQTPGSTGLMQVQWKNNLIPITDIGATEVYFYMPDNTGSYFSFPTQLVQPGITWGVCTPLIASTPCIKATIDPLDPLLQDYITFQIEYTIPTTYLSPYTIIKNLMVETVFADPLLHDCEHTQIQMTVPVFQATDTTGLTVICDVVPFSPKLPCKDIIIVDNTVWGSAITKHEQSDFSLQRKITITNPGGNQYIMSSIAAEPNNEVIDPASLGVMQFVYELEGDGLYKVELCQAPYWSNLGTYPVGSAVSYDNAAPYKLYEAIVLNTAIEPGVNVNWTDYWKEVTVLELPDNYCWTAYYVANCELEDCYEKLSQTVFCGIDDPCSKDICEDECWINYNKLMIIRESVVVAQQIGDWAAVQDLLNMAKLICQCDCFKSC